MIILRDERNEFNTSRWLINHGSIILHYDDYSHCVRFFDSRSVHVSFIIERHRLNERLSYQTVTFTRASFWSLVIIKTNSISITSYFMMFRIWVNQRIFEILVLVSGRERDEHLYPCKIDEFLMSRTSSNTVFFSWEGKKSCSRFPASVG